MGWGPRICKSQLTSLVMPGWHYLKVMMQDNYGSWMIVDSLSQGIGFWCQRSLIHILAKVYTGIVVFFHASFPFSNVPLCYSTNSVYFQWFWHLWPWIAQLLNCWITSLISSLKWLHYEIHLVIIIIHDTPRQTSSSQYKTLSSKNMCRCSIFLAFNMRLRHRHRHLNCCMYALVQQVHSCRHWCAGCALVLVFARLCYRVNWKLGLKITVMW